MMVGTASLPHILMRYFTTPWVREARQSVAWSLLFIFLLYFSAPAYAAFSKLEVYTNIIGGTHLDALAVDVPVGRTRPDPNLRKECSDRASGIDACKAIAGHAGILRFQDFVINTDVIVLSTPEIAGLPYVISGLVAAGGLAAALSTADGLLLAIANALSHDVYYKMLDPSAPTIRRLTVARVLLFFVAVAFGGYLLRRNRRTILAMVGWAFSLAMAGNFPAIVHRHLVETHDRHRGDLRDHRRLGPLPVLSRRDPRYFPQAGVKYFGMTSLLNPLTGKPIDCPDLTADPMARRMPGEWPTRQPAGQQGRLVRPQQHQLRIAGDATRLPGDHRVSLLGKEPSKEMQAHIDEIRKPRGRTVLEEKT